jgi:hypothetical protein
MSSPDPNIEFSVQKKAESKFGIFPYELEPTQNYMFTLYRFYEQEKELCQSFASIKVNEIKNIGDLIGFQNYHTCQQSQNKIKEWAKNQFDLSNQDFDDRFHLWQSENHPDAHADNEISMIKETSYSQIPLDKDLVEENIAKVFDHFQELSQVPEEWIESPPHPVRFLQHRMECHIQIKKLKKSISKTNHPLAPNFHKTIYGSYLFLLEECFPVEHRKPYLNLCVIYAFQKQIK